MTLIFTAQAIAQTPAWESMDGPLPSIPDEELCAHLASMMGSDPVVGMSAEEVVQFEANCLEDIDDGHEECGSSFPRLAACAMESSTLSAFQECRTYCVELDPGPSMPVEGEPRELVYVCSWLVDLQEQAFAGVVPADHDRWISYQLCSAEYETNARRCGEAFADVTWCQVAADSTAEAEACLDACAE